MEEVTFQSLYHSVEGVREVKELQTVERVEAAILEHYDDGAEAVGNCILPSPPKTLLICECGSLCDDLQADVK